MPLSWNEIRQRAVAFSREWREASRERADAQTFWNEFFHVFGKSRRAVASFEEPVRNLGGNTDFIDLFWKGRLIGESKSRGKSLDVAHSQANDYVQSLLRDGRDDEVPRYILVTDFARLAVHDLEPTDASDLFDADANATAEFALEDLHKHVRRFAFIAGYEPQRLDPEDPANLRAVALLANLHDRLEDGGYRGHDLQRFMVRVLFCLFAEDTGIFEPLQFETFVTNRTAPDGSDLGPQLAALFDTLDADRPSRQRNLPDDLAAFPYVNGRLFAERLRMATFDAPMREALLACCRFKWDTISPVIFGSLFQSIMDDRGRRQIGAHYTGERDILKLCRSLFLDRLTARLNRCASPRDYDAFLRDLGALRLLDPACGCGNFLVLAYRELRRLEMDAIARRFGDDPDSGDLRAAARLNVGQFYGIEIEEWPALIAEVGMWLMDHQMNNELFARFGSADATVPLRAAATIKHANALRVDWADVLPPGQCSYVMGNPPFVGKHLMMDGQKQDMATVYGDGSGIGVLDYVAAWYRKAADYAGDFPIETAFVSTNSITQGEQVYPLWHPLFGRGFSIDFAHRTFRWESEARGKAHVHVVIIGFSRGSEGEKSITDYEDANGDKPQRTTASNISPYLTEGSSFAIKSRSRPLCDVPPTQYGSKPVDGGSLILEDADKAAFLAEFPCAEPFVRPLLCADEFLDGRDRWCLWLESASPTEVRNCGGIVQRLKEVRAFRLASKKKPTQVAAVTPGLFAEVRQPRTQFLVIPLHSSERRSVIPFGYFSPEYIVHNSCSAIPDATHYHFGVLHSAMHMAWVREVCGRLKSDYRYSAKLVYNNFPWPAAPDAGRRSKVESAAGAVLSARSGHAGSTLADLYDPLAMPADLARAHAALDRAVDLCYRPQPFPDERRRFEHLFALHERLVDPLTAPARRGAEEIVSDESRGRGFRKISRWGRRP